ncbi:hypothetical protein MOQ72_00680 [Saccharopolyspora sp. K220]|uniref:hypothetical protein n=1 Tax=Saccharopolyspora soli TaxID=2926618 RepID=UPI001F55C899|nr:hypothetical protein [Saccharopolyspora soli]MCI2415925.1 hypothetical protein [Saccharopolyspora soli]
MRPARVVLALPGLAALVWGGVLFGQFVLSQGSSSIVAWAWLLGGPVVHDGLVAPVVGLAGLVITRVVPHSWRGPLLVGAALSGVLGLLSVPLLWRRYGTPPSPGLHDGDTSTGLLVALGLIWVLVLLIGLANTWRRARAAAQ